MMQPTAPMRSLMRGTNGRAENLRRCGGTPGRFESQKQRSGFGDLTGRLARKSVAHVSFSYVFLGKHSASSTNHPVIQLNDQGPAAILGALPPRSVFRAATKIGHIGACRVTDEKANDEAETDCTDSERKLRICHGPREINSRHAEQTDLRIRGFRQHSITPAARTVPTNHRGIFEAFRASPLSPHRKSSSGRVEA